MIVEVVLPVLSVIGERWRRGEQEIAREHFASNLIGGRLRGLARGWDVGTGPRAVLACPAGERHDLGLVAFGLALRERGWRITLLGHDSPAAIIERAAIALSAAAVVLAAVVPERFADPGARRTRTRPAARDRRPRSRSRRRPRPLGAVLLEGDPYTAAAQVSVIAR